MLTESMPIHWPLTRPLSPLSPLLPLPPSCPSDLSVLPALLFSIHLTASLPGQPSLCPTLLPEHSVVQTGLQYKVIESGPADGAHPKPNSPCKCHYSESFATLSCTAKPLVHAQQLGQHRVKNCLDKIRRESHRHSDSMP
jgi:hypothetical protein